MLPQLSNWSWGHSWSQVSAEAKTQSNPKLPSPVFYGKIDHNHSKYIFTNSVTPPYCLRVALFATHFPNLPEQFLIAAYKMFHFHLQIITQSVTRKSLCFDSYRCTQLLSPDGIFIIASTPKASSSCIRNSTNSLWSLFFSVIASCTMDPHKYQSQIHTLEVRSIPRYQITVSQKQLCQFWRLKGCSCHKEKFEMMSAIFFVSHLEIVLYYHRII